MPDRMQTSAQDLEASEKLNDDEWERWRKSVEFRFGIGDRQFGRLRAEMKRNTDITSEIRDIVIAFGAFSRFCKRVGHGVAWCSKWVFRVLKVGGAVAASIAAIWGVIWAIAHGLPPPAAAEALPGREQPHSRPVERPNANDKR